MVMSLNQARKLKGRCEIIDVTAEKKKKEVKLTKSGEVKKTPNNTKYNRDDVQPFKEEDISKMVKALKTKLDSSIYHDDEMARRRNLTIMICGVNIGLRCSDLVSLKWSDVYDKDWNFLDGKKIMPKKTKKTGKHVLLKYNNDFRRAMEFYREHCGKIKNMDDYIFMSRQGGHITVDSVGLFIKNTAQEIGIKYNVNTHSLRKSFGRLRYDHAEDKSKVLVELMVIYGHSSVKVTKHYICITDEEIENLYNDVSIGFDAIFN